MQQPSTQTECRHAIIGALDTRPAEQVYREQLRAIDRLVTVLKASLVESDVTGAWRAADAIAAFARGALRETRPMAHMGATEA